MNSVTIGNSGSLLAGLINEAGFFALINFR